MKTVLITGATSGIGLEVAKECVKNGYRVIGIGRSIEKNNTAINLLKETSEFSEIKYYNADLLEVEAVKSVAKEIACFIEAECNGQLYGLINNAGCVRSWFQTNSSGYEHQFALNHLASVMLTHQLLPYLIKGAGRIIMTSSKSHKLMKIHWKDIMFEKGYRPLMVYKQSKLCNLLFAYVINDRYISQGIKAYAVDPGLVNTRIGLKNTKGLVNKVWNIRRKLGVSPSIPAKTYIWILNQKDHPNSLYYFQSAPRKHSKEVNKNNSDRLLYLSEKLLNIKFGGKL
ncbi:MAG: SDR family NAD(P)-dependent oxidoreductase [Bacilli bacterium]|jgi:NAD(P)-dependent dehydrogenase (short-subunit alcohol dehydrogenase family)